MRPTILLLTLLATAHLLSPTLRVRAQTSDANETTQALHALFDAEWEYTMEQNPTWASTLGDRRWNDRWDDDSMEAILKRREHTMQSLTRLNSIDRAKLSAAD
ncbi:MAG TPA: hypothetical protein VE842_10580, partial [Pyrinomonadaceae bacterium]|nr:hypothetical protein [Pyrinomonadaceae bacterium]